MSNRDCVDINILLCGVLKVITSDFCEHVCKDKKGYWNIRQYRTKNNLWYDKIKFARIDGNVIVNAAGGIGFYAVYWDNKKKISIILKIFSSAKPLILSCRGRVSSYEELSDV